MSKKSKYPVKNCREEIRVHHFTDVIEATKEYGNLSSEGEWLLLTARNYLAQESAYKWKNAKIAVFGSDLQLVFVSGCQSFQLVVILNDVPELNKFCEDRGWNKLDQVSNQNTTANIWGDIRGTLTDRLMGNLVQLIKEPSSFIQVTQSNGTKKVQVAQLSSRKTTIGTGLCLKDSDMKSQQLISKRVAMSSKKWVFLFPLISGVFLSFIAALVVCYGPKIP